MRAQQSRCENVRVRCFYLCRLSWIASRREPAARVTCLDSRVHQTSKQPSRRRIAKRDLSNLSEGGRRSAGVGTAMRAKGNGCLRVAKSLKCRPALSRFTQISLPVCVLSDRQTVFNWDTNPHTPRLYFKSALPLRLPRHNDLLGLHRSTHWSAHSSIPKCVAVCDVAAL